VAVKSSSGGKCWIENAPGGKVGGERIFERGTV